MTLADLAGGAPDASGRLGYRLTGLGSTPVPGLGVTLDLDGAAAAAAPLSTFGDG